MALQLKTARTLLWTVSFPVISIALALAWFPVAAQAAPAGRLVAVPADAAHVGSYYICLNSAYTECIVSQGVGHQVIVSSAGRTRFHFYIAGQWHGNQVKQWETPGGRCLRENNSQAVIIAHGRCLVGDNNGKWVEAAGRAGNPPITYRNYGHMKNFMGTYGSSGSSGTLYVYAKPPHKGFYRGWQLF